MSEPTAATYDGFGQRFADADLEKGDTVELLELSPALVEHQGFVAALGERVARFASVRHASYVHLRRLDRPARDRLVLVSDDTPGWRLSSMIGASAVAGAPLDICVVIGLLRQLLPAVALYGRHNRDAAIGALAPERLIVTAQGRLVIAEHAFGPALEKLGIGRERLWRDYRVAMPLADGLPQANARADACAIGVVALTLVLGRLLDGDEYPGHLQPLLDGATERRDGDTAPLSAAMSSWIGRALQLDSRSAFQSPHEAQLAFEFVLSSDRTYVTSSTALDEWVTRVGSFMEQARSGMPPAEPAAPPAAIEAAPAPAPPAGTASARSPLVLALVVFAIVQSGVVLWLWNREPGAPPAGQGELVIQSRPAGARISIDSEDRGVTPLTLGLPAGAHVIEVQIGRSEPRVIPITIRTGVQTAQYIELQNVPTTGGLDITSDPPGARVSIDGRTRGSTPLTIRDLPPGDHTVLIEAGGRKVTQAVRIDAGVTAQLVVPLPRR
jgi:hypothetical protein